MFSRFDWLIIAPSAQRNTASNVRARESREYLDNTTESSLEQLYSGHKDFGLSKFPSGKSQEHFKLGF